MPAAPEARSLSERLARLMAAHPWFLVALIVAVMVPSALLLPRLQIASGFEPFLDPDSREHELDEVLTEHFVNDDSLFILYKTDDLFSQRSLEAIRELGHRIDDLVIPGTERDPVYMADEVSSLTTLKDPISEDETFRTVPLVPDPVPSDAAELAHIRERALGNPIINDSLISKHGQASLLVVRLNREISMNDQLNSAGVDALRALLQEWRERFPDMNFHAAGDAVLRTDLARRQAADVAVFIPAGYVLSLLLLFLFVRTLRSIGVALAVVTVVELGAMALVVLLGSSINNCSAMLPPVMIALTIAIVLHFFSEYAKHTQHMPGREAGVRTIGDLLAPAFMAAITTAIGFASLAVSRLPAVHDFGLAAAGAIILAFVVAVSAMALLFRAKHPERIVSPRSMATSEGYLSALDGLSALLIRRRWAVLTATLVFLVVIGAGAYRIVVDMNQLGLLPTDAPARQAHDFMDTYMGGSTTYVVSIKADREGRFLEPEVLRQVDALYGFMRDKLGMETITSALDYIKLMNRAYLEDKPAEYRVPDSAAQAAQLLLINGDPTIEQYLDDTRQWLRIVARNGSHSTQHIADTYQALERYLDEHFPQRSGFDARGAGMSRQSANLTTNLIDNQITSLSISVVLILALMFVMFRSFITGVVSLLPNIFPIVADLGLMGWSGINLDAATVMIATVALGIAVDDTVHFLQHYRTRIAEHGEVERAVHETLHIKGPAIIWTSVVISLGFAVTAFSSFAPTRDFGILICAAMVAALLGDLIMLPAFLLCTKTRLGVKVRENAGA